MTARASHLAASSSLPRELHVLVPFWGLAGGVIKILDYAAHGADLGINVTLWAPPLPHASEPIFELPVAQRLLDDVNVTHRPLDELDLPQQGSCVVLFTEPTHHDLIEAVLREPLGEDLFHLIQGTRHANPTWQDGRNYRLLHRPMQRIAVTPQVFDAIAPIANQRYPITTILEGHDVTWFGGRPQAPAGATPRTSPLRVLYTTWKSDIGDRVADLLREDSRFAFVAIRQEVGWPALRKRYHGADIFLCAPGPEEGFYLPGLEAMAAGAAVVSAEVGGNRAYLRPGENAVLAEFDNAASHVDALTRLADDVSLQARLVKAGYGTIDAHTLARERSEFASVLRSRKQSTGSALTVAYDTNTADLEAP